jgi:hypothetical protein
MSQGSAILGEISITRFSTVNPKPKLSLEGCFSTSNRANPTLPANRNRCNGSDSWLFELDSFSWDEDIRGKLGNKQVQIALMVGVQNKPKLEKEKRVIVSEDFHTLSHPVTDNVGRVSVLLFLRDK